MSAKIARHVVRFLKKEDGPTAVEYAVMLTFIIIVCIAAVTALGQGVNSGFQDPTLTNAVKAPTAS